MASVCSRRACVYRTEKYASRLAFTAKSSRTHIHALAQRLSLSGNFATWCCSLLNLRWIPKFLRVSAALNPLLSIQPCTTLKVDHDISAILHVHTDDIGGARAFLSDRIRTYKQSKLKLCKPTSPDARYSSVPLENPGEVVGTDIPPMMPPTPVRRTKRAAYPNTC